MAHFRDAYAKIRLDYLKDNVNLLYQKVEKPMMAIIKANAYGHGYQQVADVLKDHEHIAMFGVATLKEAIDLRKLGVKQDILVLGAIPLEDVDLTVLYNITLTVFSLDYVAKIATYHQKSLEPIKVHLKIDTGMNRLGMKSREEFVTFMEEYPQDVIQIEGIFTHFATADEPSKDDEYHKQIEMFYQIIEGYPFKYIHCQNSAAMMYHHDNRSNLARIGIAMYGVAPNGEDNPDLKQVMSLYARVVMIKKVPQGEKIGYGMTYTTSEDEYIATLPIGYADGFIRANQGRHVYINGKLYPIVGRVCMDQMMVKVDETVQVQDEVEIFGEHITLCQMAKELDTIPYEITCLIAERIERDYIDEL